MPNIRIYKTVYSVGVKSGFFEGRTDCKELG